LLAEARRSRSPSRSSSVTRSPRARSASARLHPKNPPPITAADMRYRLPQPRTSCPVSLLQSTSMSESEASGNRLATLLLVDDEPANLDSLERIFAREGYRTLRAENASAALEMLRAGQVDVVLTDLMMPGLSGQELLK